MKTLMNTAAALALLAAAPVALHAADADAVKPGMQTGAPTATATATATGDEAYKGSPEAVDGDDTIAEVEIPDVKVTEPVTDGDEAKPGMQPEGTPKTIGEIKTPDLEIKKPLKDQAEAKPGLQADVAAMDESALEGADVIDAKNENIGEFVKFVKSDAGAPTEAVIDVGGFLGLGEHRVAVPLDMVTFTMKDGETMMMVNATADQLKDMPAYKS